MGDKTTIPWTDSTWNTVVGCTKVSPGCRECYAEKLLASRMKHMPVYGDVTKDGKWTGQTALLAHRLDQPLRWRKPRKIFVNDLGDTFHESVAFEFVAALFGVMAACPQHTFQLLSKRPGRMLEFFEWLTARGKSVASRRRGETDDPRWAQYACVELAHQYTTAKQYRPAYDHRTPWPLPNVWLGVTAEDQQRADERIPLLLQCPAAVRFVSAEPLIGPIDFRRVDYKLLYGSAILDALAGKLATHPVVGLDGVERSIPLRHQGRIDWAIVGGESGPRARPCDIAWIRSIRDQCREAGTACFVKQLGRQSVGWDSSVGARRVAGGWWRPLRDRSGADPDEWPVDLRVREWPRVSEAA